MAGEVGATVGRARLVARVHPVDRSVRVLVAAHRVVERDRVARQQAVTQQADLTGNRQRMSPETGNGCRWKQTMDVAGNRQWMLLETDNGCRWKQAMDVTGNRQ